MRSDETILTLEHKISQQSDTIGQEYLLQQMHSHQQFSDSSKLNPWQPIRCQHFALLETDRAYSSKVHTKESGTIRQNKHSTFQSYQ